jgi:hypothetical protein
VVCHETQQSNTDCYKRSFFWLTKSGGKAAISAKAKSLKKQLFGWEQTSYPSLREGQQA